MEYEPKIQPVIIGAGPAGLTAAREFLKHGVTSIVLESDKVVGGISRTVQQNGWRFDIGGHRFFTKVPRIEEVWHEILPDDDFMLRPRMSRIYYNKKFFDYPLKASNALRNLGLLEAIRCVLSYIGVRIRPPRDLSSFEGWRLHALAGAFTESSSRDTPKRCGEFQQLKFVRIGRLNGLKTCLFFRQYSTLSCRDEIKKTSPLLLKSFNTQNWGQECCGKHARTK